MSFDTRKDCLQNFEMALIHQELQKISSCIRVVKCLLLRYLLSHFHIKVNLRAQSAFSQ